MSGRRISAYAAHYASSESSPLVNSDSYGRSMSDPITGKALEATGGVLTRLLGPTVDIMGARIAEAYKRRNVKKIVDKAHEKADTDRGGLIPPRVAQDVLDKSIWAENEFLAEYLSGVLASARTEFGESDNGVAWTALVGRMSSDQIALHWTLYCAIQRRARNADFRTVWDLIENQFVVDHSSLLSSLNWPRTEATLTTRLYEAVYGLKREGLLADVSHGSGTYLSTEVQWTRGRQYRDGTGYLTFKATNDGIALLLQAIGRGGEWYDSVFSDATSCAIEANPDLPRLKSVALSSDFPTQD